METFCCAQHFMPKMSVPSWLCQPPALSIPCCHSSGSDTMLVRVPLQQPHRGSSAGVPALLLLPALSHTTALSCPGNPASSKQSGTAHLL